MAYTAFEQAAHDRLESCDYGILSGRELITKVAEDAIVVGAVEIRAALAEERKLWKALVDVYADLYGGTEAADEIKRRLREEYNAAI